MVDIYYVFKCGCRVKKKDVRLAPLHIRQRHGKNGVAIIEQHIICFKHGKRFDYRESTCKCGETYQQYGIGKMAESCPQCRNQGRTLTSYRYKNRRDDCVHYLDCLNKNIYKGVPFKCAKKCNRYEKIESCEYIVMPRETTEEVCYL